MHACVKRERGRKRKYGLVKLIAFSWNKLSSNQILVPPIRIVVHVNPAESLDTAQLAGHAVDNEMFRIQSVALYIFKLALLIIVLALPFLVRVVSDPPVIST